MARIVLGLGTSHSTQCSLTPDWWEAQGEVDRKRTPFDELVTKAPSWMKDELKMDVWQRKYDAIQAAIAKLGATLTEVAPDVLVIIGDDQRELFLDDTMPTFSVFWGENIWDLPGPTDNLAPSHRAGRWAVHADEPEAYPTDPELGRHIVEFLMHEEFDVSQFTRQPEGRSLGHAWTFVRRRLMKELQIPMVPIMINTYFPPNQPTPKRCYDLGRALRRAIENWKSDKMVAIVASGGLSHFVVDEDLDQQVIEGIKEGNAEKLTSIPSSKLQAGSSEILNWIAAAGALEELEMELIDYIPGYRSAAGTGCGLTFATWR